MPSNNPYQVNSLKKVPSEFHGAGYSFIFTVEGDDTVYGPSCYLDWSMGEGTSSISIGWWDLDKLYNSGVVK